ncbi:hypothetical protein PC39_11657 [Salinisphaera sp. PC39]|uniref:hypothetical protein n=1 Tax=Salinisphaera sp. PC39 TaxID=1304156 RepID=UPI00333F1C19
MTVRRVAAPLALALLAAGCDGNDRAPDDTRLVELAFLETPVADAEPDAGCDTVVYETFRVPAGEPPVTAALERLFALRAERVRGHRHFLARTRDTLRLARVDHEGNAVHVYLTGTLTGLRGTCDDPRAAIQIRHTARRVSGIETVHLHLDGRRTDLRPDARGAGP